MKISNDIINSAAKYSTELLKNKLSENYCYHNLLHTQEVVDAVKEMSKAMDLYADEKNVLTVAAWFHDLGYVWHQENHENTAADLAEKFLIQHNIDADQVANVKSCIMATKYPQRPATLIEKIICDADLIHTGRKSFFEKTLLLREEWRLTRAEEYTDDQWNNLNLGFLRVNAFHTSYCRKKYAKRKTKNIEAIEAMLHQSKKNSSSSGIELIANVTGKEKSAKTKSAGRGVETLFKIASNNHMQLSGMADSKAHILLSINSIIISIVITVLLKKLEESSYLALPTALLLGVCLVTSVFAILATQPKISKGIFTREQVSKREANLLFFGNFHKMDLGTYEWGVKEIMNDEEYLYGSITRDVFYLGKVLATKYRYLYIGYRIFMFGMIGSVLSFGISFFVANHT